MKKIVLTREVTVPRPIEEVWDFFSRPENLNLITPPNMSFVILTPLPIEMKPGARIDYRINVKGIPMKWRTLISEWEPGRKFVDEQEKGPYVKWHHTHEFESVEGGTLMRDRVEYVVPGGPFQALIIPFVRRDVEAIFDYRTKVLTERFS